MNINKHSKIVQNIIILCHFSTLSKFKHNDFFITLYKKGQIGPGLLDFLVKEGFLRF